MDISYQNANVYEGNESTLLRFHTNDGTTACILIDAGDGVDLDALLADDEYLNAILLTHGHIDHYRTLGDNVRHNAPIYTAPATATIVERALPEAQKHNDLGAVSDALDALEPIEDWTAILPNLEVRPIPVGHTPGAVGFVIRFHDEASTNSAFDDEMQYLLATGDFTTRPCAGYPGLETALPVDIDAVLLNVATTDEYTTHLNDSLRTILERGFAGSSVVVATSALTGVHYATLLGHLADELDRTLPIRLVGQTAKLWDDLDFDTPNAESQRVFSEPSEVLDSGAITICGPDEPVRGSAKRLFGAIENDPSAVFVQLTTGGAEPVSGGSCTAHAFEVINHPTPETLDETVAELAPQHVVIKHATGGELNRFQKRYDECFTWGTNDSHEHTLYESGEWVAPGWLTDRVAQKIRMQQWQALGDKPVATRENFPVPERTPIDVATEGVAVDEFRDQFSTQSIETDHDGRTSGPSASTENRQSHPETTEDVRDDPAAASSPDSETDSFESTVLTRLDAIEAKLDAEDATETVTARVLSGDGQTFLQVLDETDLPPGQLVELQINKTATDDSD